MNGYICTKSCTFGGVAYSVGDAIPFDAVLPSRERALIKQGFIAKATDPEALQKENEKLIARIEELEKDAPEGQEPPPGGEKEPEGIVIPITAQGGILELIMTPGDIIMAVATLQLNAEEAAKAVAEIEKEETLILIDALDERKTVKRAIMAKVEEMQAKEEDDGEEGGNKEDEGQGDE
jgi:hypothetical protein